MLAEWRDNVLLAVLFCFLFALSIWLQFGVVNNVLTQEYVLDEHDADYYIENFVIVGQDDDKIRYKLSADKLIHYPKNDRALLNNPVVLKYSSADKEPMRASADSGLLYDNQSKLKLAGNVRVTGSEDISGGSLNTANMTIRLK